MECPKCKKNIEEGAIICSNCSYDLRKEFLKEEKRICTVVFADIKGFTSLSERLEPEDVKEIIDKVFNSLSEIIEKNGGYIDKYIGDCIMALFGAPLSYGDDAERAVKSALEMQKKIKEISGMLKNIGEEELKIRIGINTGEVIAGVIGTKRSYTVLGDTVNTAQRIESICKPGKVWVSESTYKQTQRVFDFKPIGKKKLKGKKGEITVYEVLGFKKRPEILKKEEFIDRNEEIKKIYDNIKNSEKKGVFIFVKGDTGLGKTRLLNEIEKRYNFNFKWIYPDPLSTSYMNVSVSILSGFFPLKEKLYELKKDEESIEVGEILDYVINPGKVKIKFSDEKEKKNIVFYAFQYFFRIFKNKIYIIENAHFMDDKSLELLSYLSDTLRDFPVCFIVLTRSFFYEEKKLHTLKNFETIELTPFDYEKTREYLIKNLNIKGDESIIEDIYKNTLGVPLYLRNIVEFLLREGVVEKKDGYMTIKEGKIKLPSSFHDIVRRNIDLLDDDEKTLLLGMSFLGDRFDFELVEKISKEKRLSLRQKIDGLSLKGIIEKERNENFFKFSSPLYRSVLIDSILKINRKIMSKAIADSLSELLFKRKDIYPIIAECYEMAEEREKAIENYYLYFKEAERIRNLKEMERILHKLEELGADREKILEVKYYLGLGYMNEGLMEEAKSVFLETLKEDYKDVWKYYLMVLVQKGDLEEAEKFINSRIEAEKDSRKLSWFFYELGIINHYRLNIDRAKYYYLKALNISDKDKEMSTNILNSLGGVYEYKGEYEKALFYYTKALQYAEEIGNQENIPFYAYNIGNLLFRMNKLEDGFEYIKRALHGFKKNKNKLGEMISIIGCGYYYMETGKLIEAEKLFAKALNNFLLLGIERYIPLMYHYLSSVKLKRFRLKDSLKYAELCVEESKKRGFVEYELYGLLAISKTYFFMGDIFNAEKFITRGVEFSKKKGLSSFELYFVELLFSISLIKQEKDKISDYFSKIEHFSKLLNKWNIYYKNLLKKFNFERDFKSLKLVIDEIREKEDNLDRDLVIDSYIYEAAIKDNKEELLSLAMNRAKDRENYFLFLKSLYHLCKVNTSYSEKFERFFKRIDKEIKDKEIFMKILSI